MRLDSLHPMSAGVFTPWVDVDPQHYISRFGQEYYDQARAIHLEMPDVFVSASTHECDWYFDPEDNAHRFHSLKPQRYYKRSLLNDNLRRNEIAFPAFPNNNWIAYDKSYCTHWQPRKLSNACTIGFCGVYHRPTVRKEVIKRFRFHKDITFHIVKRRRFANKDRKTYVNSIQNNDFTLSVRGVGNFDYRMYETISLGRIPIIVDTKRVLPDISPYKWEDFCIIVKRNKDMVSNFLEIYEQLTEEKYEEMQVLAREVWHKKLNPIVWSIEQIRRYWDGHSSQK